MRLLYINNFRGFKETFIPINRVNFFVGENSTGKTSLLKLFKLISGFHFQYNYEFYSPEVDLGRFEDIINKFDSDDKFFEIALCSDLNKNEIEGPLNETNRYRFLKVKYVEKDEKTVLSEFYLQSPFVDITIKLDGDEYVYSYKVTQKQYDRGKTEELFLIWAKEAASHTANLKVKKVKRDAVYKNQFRWIFREIIEELEPKMNKKNGGKGLDEIFSLYSIGQSFFPDIKWIAPIRAEPRRIYEHLESKSSADGSHAPQVLKEMLLGSNTKSLIRFKQFLEKFGKSSHLFDEIKIRKFGNDKFAPFEIEVYLEGKPYSISNVGYGVSQVLPLLLEIFDEKNKWIAIQQPEVHLHPKAQAEFGEVIFNSMMDTNQVFFIETHSDFTIDRFRYCVSQHGLVTSKGELLDAQILFFQRVNKGNSVEPIMINGDGSYRITEQSLFREFFINESIKLLGI